MAAEKRQGELGTGTARKREKRVVQTAAQLAAATRGNAGRDGVVKEFWTGHEQDSSDGLTQYGGDEDSMGSPRAGGLTAESSELSTAAEMQEARW
jgi:hypothetical protein